MPRFNVLNNSDRINIFPTRVQKNVRPTGAWTVQLRRNGKKYTKRWDSHAEALQDEQAIIAARDTGMDPAVANDPVMDPTVSSFETVIPRAKGQLWYGKDCEAASWRQMDTLAALLGPKTRLDSIDTRMVDGLILKLSRDKSSSTVNRYLSALRKFLSWSKSRGYRNAPVEDIEFSWRKEVAHRIRWISEAEEAQLEALLPANTWKLVYVAIETGCRRGELLAANEGHINGNRLHLWQTKTDKPRTIPMSDKTKEMLLELLRGDMPTGPMVRRHWDIARTKMGLQDDPQFVFHACRHTCATRLVDAGVNVFVIQEWLGHKRIDTTLRYAHVRPQNLDDALVKVGLFRAGQQADPQISEGCTPAPPAQIRGANSRFAA